MLTVLVTLIGAYLLTTATMSPTPPLADTVIGEVLVVNLLTAVILLMCAKILILILQIGGWSSLMGLTGYIKLSITSVFRERGGKALRWIGSMSLTGSAIGAILAFCFVNFAKIFVSKQPCT